MKFLNRIKVAVLAAAVALPLLCSQPAAHAASDALTGLPLIQTNAFFTNGAAGGTVGGLNSTNALFQLTNGATSVTSAPVALRGYGIGLELALAFTNALVTNVVVEFDFSMDGVNWGSEPILTWRTATAAHAVGRFTALTNVLEDAFKNFKFIRAKTIRLTNGVDNVGSVFSTNRPPIRIVQRYDNL